MSAASRRAPRAHRSLALLGLHALFALPRCGPRGRAEEPARALEARPEPPRDAGAFVEAGSAGAGPRCPLRAAPPEELGLGGALLGAPALASSGAEWLVAWSEQVDDAAAVYAARVRTSPHEPTTTRLSEPGYRASQPAAVWSGEAWTVVWSGGASALDELWLAHVDARGLRVGRPTQLTARARRDFSPALLYDGVGHLLVWSALLPDERSAVLSLRLSAWGAQLAPAYPLAVRRERAEAPALVRTDEGATVAWLVTRRGEAQALEAVRTSRDGTPRAPVRRAALGAVPLGGDASGRFSLAGEPRGVAVAWDELREGASRVFFRPPAPRLEAPSLARVVSAPDEAARRPALLRAPDGTYFLAYEALREGAPVVRLRALTADGEPLGEPVALQGNDGRASAPQLALADATLAVVTTSARGASLHRVALGPCAPPAAP